MTFTNTKMLSAAITFACITIVVPIAHGQGYQSVSVKGNLQPGNGHYVQVPSSLLGRALSSHEVWGKEYVNNRNIDATPVSPVLDNEQILLWDGLGGTAEGNDYSPPASPRSWFGVEDEIDALANSRDPIFRALVTFASKAQISLDVQAGTRQ